MTTDSFRRAFNEALIANRKLLIGRDFLPPELDRGLVYLFLRAPKRGYFGSNGHFLWVPPDPSDQIQVPASMAYWLDIAPGDIHFLLESPSRFKFE
jgi:hypothetical protein